MRWWGIHNNRPELDFVDAGWIALGFDWIGDLRPIGPDRDALKAAVLAAYPDAKPRAIAAWAGIFLRFVHEAAPGDVVVHPIKDERTLNFGRIAGPYEYVAEAPTRRHRRAVEWLNTGVPRDAFSQPALWEVGNTMTFFELKSHVRELSQFA